MLDFAWKPNGLWLTLGMLVVIAGLWWSYRTARGAADWRWRFGFAVLRLITIATVVVCILDPRWITEIKHYAPSRVAVLLDTSRSMALKEGDATRLEQAKAWIRDQMILPAGCSAVTYGFSSNLVTLADPADAVADGDQTCYADSLDNLAQISARNPPASVILLSDGGDNSSKKFESVARAFGEKRMPIHTVAFGSTNEPPDIIIENVQVKRTVLNQTAVRAVVTLRGPGFAGRAVPLHIQQGGRSVAEQQVQITGSSQQVEVEFTPRTSGFQTFAADIPLQNGERSMSNNRREFGLTVRDQVLRVLYMEASGMGKTGFQPLYLKHALEDIPGIQIKTLYCEQTSRSPAINDQVAYVDPKDGLPIYHVQHSTQGYPRTLDELLKYHVIICSDIPREDFTPEQLENTEKFVTQYGGGFVMVGGHTSFGSGMYQHTIIDRLIPVSMEQENSLNATTFFPRLTQNALRHPIMQISADEKLNQEIWTTKFPRLLGYNRVDRAKPGAVVLLEHPTSRTAYGPDIILAVQEVGRGRTMAFTSDTTADWGEFFESIWGEKINGFLPFSTANCDSRYFKQFWLNSARWLAAHKFDYENNLVGLELDNTYGAPNTELPVRVRAQDRQGKEIRDAEATLVLSGRGRNPQSEIARFDETAHAYLATVKLPGDGAFLLSAKVRFKDGRTGEDQQVIVGELTDFETQDVRAQPTNLSNISRWSGGKSLALHNASKQTITAMLGDVKPATIEYKRTSLWDKPWLLAVIIGLLTLEWVLRRWRFLA